MELFSIYQTALRNTPDKTAYCCGDVAISYRSMDENSRRYATVLMDMGIEKGDRVALTMHNIPQLPQLYLALYRIGAIAVPISPYNIAPEINYALVHSSSRLLLVSRELHDIACEAVSNAPLIEKVIVVDDPGADNAFNARLSGLPISSHEGCALEPSRPAMILYTSGSTAKPKGIVHTYHSLYSSAVNRCNTLAINAEDIQFNAGFLCHGAALMVTLLPVLYSGGTAVYSVKFHPPDFLHIVDQFKPTIAAMGPSHLWGVLEHPLCAATDFSSLRYVSAGGDVVSDQLHELFYQTMGFHLSESIGMTECGTYMTTSPAMTHKVGSMGKPVIGAQVRLVDEKGHDVRPGDTGQIIVRTDTMMSGYWNDEENTSLTIVDGWLQTGDVAWQDEDGYYYFAGRIKNMIVRDTCNISPKEVEDAIKQHPLIKDCGIVGIPDERHGQKVIAFILLHAGAHPPDNHELVQFTASLINGPRLPNQWVRVTELPITSMGKLDRKALQKMALYDGAPQ